MKTKPMSQQSEALALMDGKQSFGLFCEQGTGKSWMMLADAEREYGRGNIDSMLIVAPKGVDSNWVLREIPEHLEAPNIAAYYRSGGSTKNKKQIEKLFRPRDYGEVPPLRILAMNYEALATEKGYDLAREFVNCTTCYGALDESRRIKNQKALRSKRAMLLKNRLVIRRIGTGTPVANAPVDVFNQMEFLESGLLGTTSYRAFVAEYADLLPENSHLMRHIMGRVGSKYAAPQVIARNPDGTPRWRNLDKLQKLLGPHVYRVLKKDCMELPEKIYQTRFFELSPSVRKAYDLMDKEYRLEIKPNEMLSVQKLAAITKRQQITSGFANVEKGEPIKVIDGENRRIKLLEEIIEDFPDGMQFIIWAHFREEIRQIAEVVEGMGIIAVQYHGGVKDSQREIAVDQFQTGVAQVFIGQPRSGGIGLTLTAAEAAIYYSNSFDAEERNQSEDRCHRKGTTKHVTYIDLVALNTIDEGITNSLQRKDAMSAAILGDDFSITRK